MAKWEKELYETNKFEVHTQATGNVIITTFAPSSLTRITHVLSPNEARELAEALNKYATYAERRQGE